MTDPSDRLPDDYQDRIEALESELDRRVCGFPTEGLEPCDQWPAEGCERCSRHRDSDLEEALGELTAAGGSSQSLAPNETLSDTMAYTERSGSGRESIVNRLNRSYLYWIGLVAVGVLLGAGGAAVTLDGSGGQPPAERTAEPRLELDPRNPDFNQLRESYRQGNYEQVASALEELIDRTTSDSVKARAFYYRFVFHQNQQNYERALEAAERFLDQFQDHYRRAEVLYGAWFISEQFLEQPERAESYRETLLEEFPESKWANRLSS